MSDPDPLAFAVDLESVRARFEALSYFLAVLDIQAATEAIQEEIARPPMAFVSVASETAEANKLIGGHSQRVFVTLSVLFCEQVARAAKDTRDAMERTRKAVIRQGMAWTPEGAEKALEYDRYLLRGMSGGVIWGEVLFRTSYRVTV